MSAHILPNWIPQSEELEKHIIGALLLGDTASFVAFEKLKPEDFFLNKHRVLFEALVGMNHLGTAIDRVTVLEALRESGRLEAAGDETYLHELTYEVDSAANIEQHCGIVKDLSVRRTLIRSAARTLDAARTPSLDNNEVLGVANAGFLNSTDDSTDGPVSAKQALISTISLIEKCHAGEIQGLQTQFSAFNHMTGGICSPDWIVLAGRPGVGKTALALDIVDHLSTDHGKKVLFISLEMNKEQLMQRLICRRQGINFQLLRTGQLPRSEFQKIHAACTQLKSSQLYIDDGCDTTPDRVLSLALRHKARYGLDLVVVDNLSLMRADSRTENRLQEVSNITRAFKLHGKRLALPIMTLVHLSRAIEGRGEDAVPRKSDLRECGTIEQDADVVIAMHRPDQQGSKVDLHIIKQRNGPEGIVALSSDFAHMTFRPYNPGATLN